MDLSSRRGSRVTHNVQGICIKTQTIQLEYKTSSFPGLMDDGGSEIRLVSKIKQSQHVER